MERFEVSWRKEEERRCNVEGWGEGEGWEEEGWWRNGWKEGWGSVEEKEGVERI